VGVDICGDDGYRYGLWPWESGLESSAAAEELRSQIFNPPTVQDRNNWSYCWGRCVSPLPVAATAAPAPAPKPPTEKK
jgi:hypothetical protein